MAPSFGLLLGGMEMMMLHPFAIRDCGEDQMDVFETAECAINVRGNDS